MPFIQDLLDSIDSLRKEVILLVDKGIFRRTDNCVPEDINVGCMASRASRQAKALVAGYAAWIN
jgi:hypothetical protein